MTLQERLAMTQGQDNGMDIILGGIPAAAQQEQVQQLPATALAIGGGFGLLRELLS